MTRAPAATDPSRRRLRVAALAVSLALLSGVGGWVAARRVQDPRVTALRRGIDRTPVTAVVASKQLQDAVVARGDVHRSMRADVVVHGDLGPGIVTTAPPPTGTVVREGDVVARIVDRPVLLVAGELPMYRDLHPGATGDDVTQLQGALDRLGFVTSDERGRFGPSTQAEVRAWYAARGADPAPPPSEAVAALAAADDAVATARAEVEAARGAFVAAGVDATARAQATDQFEAARRRLTTATTTLDQARAAAGTWIPQAEVAVVRTLPMTVERVVVGRGGRVEGTLAVLSGGDVVVDAIVDVDDLDRLGPRAQATLLDEASGTRATATRVAGAARPATDTGHRTVRLLLDRPSPGLLGHNLRVTFAVAATDGPVLVVPLAALFAGPDGAARLQLPARAASGGAPARPRSDLVVRVGLVVDGLAEVRPVRGHLARGDRVIVGSTSQRRARSTP